MLGRNLTDWPATRAAREARRALPLAAYQAWRAEHPGSEWATLDGWFAGLQRDGVLTRAGDAEAW